MTLRITERDGASFKGEFFWDGGKYDNAVTGTITDGKIEWSTTKVIKGGVTQRPPSGTLQGDKIDVTFKAGKGTDGDN